MKKRRVNHKASSLTEAFNLTKKEKENINKIYKSFRDILAHCKVISEAIEKFEPIIKKNNSFFVAMAFGMVLRNTIILLYNDEDDKQNLI